MSVAFAAPTDATITSNVEGHTYKIFQIFTGDVDPNNAQGLVNLKYGANTPTAANVGKTVSQDDIETLNGITATAINVNDIADIESLSEFVTISDASAFRTLAYSGSGDAASVTVPSGYYLIKDEDDSQDGEDEAYTLYLMQVVQNTYAISPKADTPEVEKKVKDKNDSATTEANNAEAWQDSADYDIGDAVPFQITATLANNVTSYYKYEAVITDTASAGLTLPTNTANVTVAMYESNGTTAITGYTPTVAINGQVLTVTFTTGDGTAAITDTKLNGAKIVVTYSAELNENANIGAAGNDNMVKLTYTNNPNDKSGGDKADTPEDHNKVFTYKTVVDKIDQDGNTLEGAGFTLYKVPATTTAAAITGADAAAKNTAVASITGAELIETITLGDDEGGTFSFEGIDDGTYILCETTTPTGYNTMDPVLFTITATHDDEEDDPQLLTLTGSDPFTSTNATTGAVEADKENGTKHSMASGELYAEIVNNSGVTLPATGGIGTTIFYVAGSILVLAAAILLITKRRMGAQD